MSFTFQEYMSLSTLSYKFALLVNCPSIWSLYLSLTLCVDHLVDVGDPLYAAVFSLSRYWGLSWSFLTNFFLQNVNSLYVRKVWEKFQPFSKCFRSQNSPSLSRVVTFPDFSKSEGQRLCLWLAHSLVSSELATAAIAVDQSQETQTVALNFGKVWKSDHPWK